MTFKKSLTSFLVSGFQWLALSGFALVLALAFLLVGALVQDFCDPTRGK